MSALPEAFQNYPTNNGALGFSKGVNPASLSADQNNYNTGSNAGTIRLTASVAVNITGLLAGNDLELKIIHNIGGNNITLKDESASSGAANRFALLADLVLATDGCVALQYDATSQRWRCIGHS
jgi:hypothetical protein